MTVHVTDHPASHGAVVRELTMSRPAVRNAMDTALLAALLDALSDATADERVVALLLSGAHGHFSAGADVKEPLDHAGHVRRMELFAGVYEAVAACPKAVIAALDGSVVGGGAEVAAACDLRIAGPQTRIRFPGAALGYPVGAAKLVGLVGLGTAKDLVLTSRTVAAAEAHRIGLVQRLADAPREAALEVCHTIAGQHLQAVSFLKAQFDTFSGLGDRVAAENDALRALAEAGGDFGALTAPNPKTTSGWSAVAWQHR